MVVVHDGLGRDVRVARELRVDHDGSNSIDTSNPRNSDGYVTTLRDWDKNSRLVSETDDPDTSVGAPAPNPSTTTYGHDDLNRRTTQTNADSEVQTTVLDKDGQPTTFTDENGSIMTRTFDDLGRATQVSIAPAAGVEGTTLQTFEYDGLSRATKKTDDNGAQDDSVVLCTFDSLSRELEESQQIGALTARLVTCEFDKNSNLIQLTYPGVLGGAGRRKVTYGYRDGSNQTLNRVERIEEGAGSGSGNDIVPTGVASARIAKYGYVGPVRIKTRTYGDGSTGNGPVLTITYDALRRATQLAHAVPGTDPVFAYAFDKVGNRLMEHFLHEGVRDQYQYDSVGRLTFEGRSVNPASSTITNNQATNPAQAGADTRTWDRIDGANNWTRVVGVGVPSRTMTANEVNEYMLVDAVSRTHDDNGNVTNDGSKSYFFDAFNRLVRVRRNSDALDIAHYAYDAEGRRVRRQVQNSGSLNGTFTYFHLGATVVEEGDGAGTPQRQYVWGERLLQYKAGSSTVYCHENGYGSISRTTIEAGEIFDTRDYNAYGEFVQGGIDTGLPYAFRGWRVDPETGFYAPRGTVFYTPALGRTVSRYMGGLLNGYALLTSPINGRAFTTLLGAGAFCAFTYGTGPGKDSSGPSIESGPYPRCGPDVTGWLAATMNSNMRNELIFPGAPSKRWGVVPGATTAVGGIDFAQALMQFRNYVKAKGQWDFKASQRFTTTGCPAGCPRSVTLCGKCFNYEVPGT